MLRRVKRAVRVVLLLFEFTVGGCDVLHVIKEIPSLQKVWFKD
jgi:hypothetical protein